MKIINLKSESIEYGYNILSKYGIDGKDSSVIKGLDNSKREIIIINTITNIVKKLYRTFTWKKQNIYRFLSKQILYRNYNKGWRKRNWQKRHKAYFWKIL